MFSFLQRKKWVPHIQNEDSTHMCKRLTLKKYATTRSIAHITIYDKHKHNHYSHDTSSLELSQSMPKLISATGSYWYGRSPAAISNIFSLANLTGVLCTETVEATMPMAVESYRDVTISLWLYGSKSTLGQNTYDHAATAVTSLAHSAVTYWSCFAIHKYLRHLKNMKLLLRHGIYTCIYCVKIFSRWNIPKRRSEAKIGQNLCSGAL